jgi:hypothetical protein
MDLWKEYSVAGRSAKVEHYQRLVALGCPIQSLAALAPDNWPFGVAKVQWLPGGLFELAEGGESAVIMPVSDEGCGLFSPEPFDLIAWRTSRPRRWAWRCGLAPALGEGLIDYCDVLPVVETPLDWLARAGECLCVLDWQAPPSFWERLRLGPRLVVQSDDLRAKLRAAFRRTMILPDMEVNRAA